MSKLFIEDTSLVAIADAIRGKAGTTDTMSPAEMVTAINALTIGEGSGTVVVGGAEVNWTTILSTDGKSFDFTPYLDSDEDFFFLIYVGYTYPNATDTMRMGLAACSLVEDMSCAYQFTAGNTYTNRANYTALASSGSDGYLIAPMSRGNSSSIGTCSYENRIYTNNNGVSTTHNAILIYAKATSGGESGSTTPTGYLEILDNGTYDVTEYASAVVNVAKGVFPTGVLEITENGSHDVYNYSAVDVNVATDGITPTGTITITSNGDYDVTEFATASINVAGTADIEPIVLTDNQAGAFKGTLAQTFVTAFPDKISTENISDASSMFYGYTLEEIPFDVNFKNYGTTSSTTSIALEMFRNCVNLKTMPAVNYLHPASINYMFYACQKLQSFPDDFAENWNFYAWHNSGWFDKNYLFYNCYSLRKAPQALIDNLYCNQTDSYYNNWNYNFFNCYNLDEVVDIPLPYQPKEGATMGTVSSNCFTATFSNCYNLKRLTFKSGQSGNYSAQVLDLSTVGWMTVSNTTEYQRTKYNYNSGRTIDDCIYDDATYAANKDNPNAYVAGTSAEEIWKYSLYNHDSAVETINSLPDFSTGSANYIKFKGEAGAYTDGGAINTLTEAEIAVATAKGWTVQLV